jgi:hypothetical protein
LRLSNLSISGSKKHAILGVNTHATYRRYVQKQPLKFLREVGKSPQPHLI